MLTHKKKIKLARSLRSTEEIKRRTPIFLTDNWIERKDGIRARVMRQVEAARKRRLRREEILKKALKNISKLRTK